MVTCSGSIFWGCGLQVVGSGVWSAGTSADTRGGVYEFKFKAV